MTAVEWLQEQYDNCPESFLTDDDFNKAKQMEKEHIVNAHLTGLIYPLETGASLQAEEYYNQTYKTQVRHEKHSRLGSNDGNDV